MTQAKLRTPAEVRPVFDGQSMNVIPYSPRDVPSMATRRMGLDRWRNISIVGMGWTALAADSDHMARLRDCARRADGLTDVLVMNGGQGDVIQQDLTPAQCYAAAVSYATTARTLGYDYIVGCTWPAWGAGFYGFTPAQLAKREAVNDLYLADEDEAFDVVANCHTGVLADATNLDYFLFDELHLAPRGGSDMATQIADAALTLPPFS